MMEHNDDHAAFIQLHLSIYQILDEWYFGKYLNRAKYMRDRDNPDNKHNTYIIPGWSYILLITYKTL